MLGQKKDSKRDLRSEAAVISKKKPSALTKDEMKIIKQRMAEIKKYKDDVSATQNTIRFMQMYKDGVCRVTKNTYSKTVQFFDANYQLADFEEQNLIFSKLKHLKMKKR